MRIEQERAMVLAANRVRRLLRLGEEAARAGDFTDARTQFETAEEAAGIIPPLFAEAVKS